MILELGEEELIEAPRVTPLFNYWDCTLDNLFTPEENEGVDDYGAIEILGVSGSECC